MNFEEYLISKKIDSAAFQKAEPSLWKEWNDLFSQMHPNSFTIQKLNLINPVRRKYQLKIAPTVVKETVASKIDTQTQGASIENQPGPKLPTAKPVVPRPVIKPKPNIN